eukprot:3038632-Pyramimonas_sp.AAC.2
MRTYRPLILQSRVALPFLHRSHPLDSHFRALFYDLKLKERKAQQRAGGSHSKGGMAEEEEDNFEEEEDEDEEDNTDDGDLGSFTSDDQSFGDSSQDEGKMKLTLEEVQIALGIRRQAPVQ